MAQFSRAAAVDDKGQMFSMWNRLTDDETNSFLAT